MDFGCNAQPNEGARCVHVAIDRTAFRKGANDDSTIAMTWVIGAASLLSTGALISDVRVRLSTGETREMLQKAYPICNYMAAGFAGSVRIGFQLLNCLSELTSPPGVPDGFMVDPVEVAEVWSPIAQAAFRGAPPEERAVGSQILIVGVSPVEDIGGPELPRIFVIRSVAPDFVPRKMRPTTGMLGIGTGSSVPHYKRALRPLFRLTSGIQHAHMIGLHGWAQQFTFSATIAIRDYPDFGISESLHVVAIRRGQMITLNNDMTTYPPNQPPVELQMPRVATKWEEFTQLAEAANVPAAAASC